MNRLHFDHPTPYFKKGFHLDQTWFSGGRVAASIARHGGIAKIVFFGRQAARNNAFFETQSIQSSWIKLFRLCIVIDGSPFYPEFNQTHLYPFGYTSECTIEEVHFRHELLLLNDTVIQRVKVLSNPLGKRLSLKAISHATIRSSSKCRKWAPWAEESGSIFTSAVDTYSEEECQLQVERRKKNSSQAVTFEIPDVPHAETHVAIGAHSALLLNEIYHSDRGDGEAWKYYINSDEFNEQAAMFICFSPDINELRKRTKALTSSVFSECDALLKSYSARLNNSPQIHLNKPAVQSCLTAIPPVLDSLKVKDIPGGLRASANSYWIWSWDSLVHSSAYLYSNDADFLKDMLILTNRYTDRRLGIPHLVTTKMQPILAMAFAPQCIYIIALYNYYFFTRDKETLKTCYPLAVWLIKQCLAKEVQGTGLNEGIANFPDYQDFLDQTGHDICAINNSVFYQGVMALRCLTQEMSHIFPAPCHTQFEDELKSLGERCRNNFIRYLYDPQKGYFVDSVDSCNFSKRLHYPVHAILWMTHFAADLLGTHTEEIADFMIKNFPQRHGLSMYPVWDSCFLKDGNQLGAYYPVTETFFCNIMKLTDRAKELNAWFDNVAWFWNTHTFPEGFTYDAMNEDLTPDEPGGKQAFSAKSWYDILFRTIAGIEVDERGLVITPSRIENSLSIENLRIGNKRIGIKIIGNKQGIINLNDYPVDKSGIVALSKLEAVNQLTY